MIMKKFLSSSPIFFNNGIAFVRIVTGVLLVYHGLEVFDADKMKMYTGWFIDKNYNAPSLWSYTGKLTELLVGIGYILGFLTRFCSIAAIAAFSGIIFMLGDRGKILQGDQHPFLFILLALIFIFTGPGKLSLDHLFFSGKKR